MSAVGSERQYHGEGGGARPVLGLHHLVAAELDAVGQRSHVGIAELGTRHLRQQRQDGGSGVAANDVDLGLADVELLVLGHEGVGAHHIKSGDTKQLLWVVNTCNTIK